MTRWTSAIGGRKDPLLLVISTQAAIDLAPMSQLVDYGLRIRRGEIKDPAFHLTLHTAPPDADPWSIKTWRRANPALGDFRSLEDVRRLAKQAQRMPSQENTFQKLGLESTCLDRSSFYGPSGVEGMRRRTQHSDRGEGLRGTRSWRDARLVARW